jgi:hypothetical protein
LDLEHRHQYDKRLLLSREQAAEEARRVLDIMSRHVKDPKALRAIRKEIGDIIDELENV